MAEKAPPVNRYDIALDSLKTVFSKSKNDKQKARLAIDITGLLLSHRGTDKIETWLAQAEKYQAACGDKTAKGFILIFRSFRLPSKEMEMKYRLLSDAEQVLPANEYTGRNLARYTRILYDLAYNKTSEARQNLSILKSSLDAQDARPFIWGHYYFQQLAQLEWNNKNYKEALLYFIEMRKYLEKDPSYNAGIIPYHFGTGYYEDPVALDARTCNNIGVCYSRLDSFEKAISWYKKAIERYKTQDNMAGSAWTSQLVGECFLQFGMYNEAETWLKEALTDQQNVPRIASDDILKKDYITCLTEFSDAATHTRHFAATIDFLDSCARYIKVKCSGYRNYYSTLISVELARAKAFAMSGNRTEVESCLLKVNQLSENVGKDDLGSEEVKNLSEANEICRRMLIAWLSKKVGDSKKHGAYKNLSLIMLNQVTPAEDQFIIYKKISWYLIDAGDNEDIVKYHSRFYTLLKNKSSIADKKNLSGNLADAYARMKRYDSAYAYKNISARLSDSLQSSQSIYAIEDLSEKYGYESEKLVLSKQNETLSHRQTENILLFSVGGIVLLMLIALLLLNRQRLINLHKFEKAQREKLGMELSQQQKELSSAALEIVRSNNAYEGLIQDLEHIGKTVKGDNRRQLKNLIVSQKILNQEDSWRQFNMHFEKMNSGFYNDLLKLEPSLTDSEKKICALMALGLSNKEISAVTFQSIKSIYTYKNRLRKKFATDSDDELSERLSKLLSN
jgi:tetratricopeptide (TPR) repeat protein/DNA-binding CsgD family transcriptional regulator